MKKFISIALILVVLMSLGSCDWFKAKESVEEEITMPTTSKRAVIITKDELASKVKEGKVDGVQFPLGASLSDVKDFFFEKVSPWTITVTSSVTEISGTSVVVTETSPYDNPQMVTAIGEKEDMYKYQVGNSLTSVYYDGEQYFYVNGNESAGAAIIVSNISAYGFKMGNCLEEDVIASIGEPDVRDVPDLSQLFFCLGSPVNPTRLTYNFQNKRLDFVFSDGNLLVVTLTNTDVYSGFSTVEETTAS